ncbi:large subunit ribosomal protein L21 [Balneicella halophila]|uniref:Large ribosomal subunit protein bL21 n=1 Tax=Balneicella halophila TaxID=1537566 RepID=A0A7L4UT82_BALHA|nr:50S ribosomal protein L21 [Balneicella halophila]PVX52527.1 large subunit ribosomal protein L21 [Balneicella halophila]
MYAIVEIAGKQFKVNQDQKITVHRLNSLKEGDKVDFDKVLLVDNDGSIQVGTPVLESAKVSAEVLKHFRGEKVKVFKKKRRKGYQKLNGHRQDLTQLKITEIVG